MWMSEGTHIFQTPEIDRARAAESAVDAVTFVQQQCSEVCTVLASDASNNRGFQLMAPCINSLKGLLRYSLFLICEIDRRLLFRHLRKLFHGCPLMTEFPHGAFCARIRDNTEVHSIHRNVCDNLENSFATSLVIKKSSQIFFPCRESNIVPIVLGI